MSDRFPVAVIGAGQAGLATSYYMAASGTEHGDLSTCFPSGQAELAKHPVRRESTKGSHSETDGVR